MKRIIIALLMIASTAMSGDILWYGSQTKANIEAAMAYLNTSDFLPAPGFKQGVEVPNQTTSWCDVVSETENGWYCIPKIPDKRLDILGVSAEARVAFIQAFGITILTNPVIKVVEEIEE